MFVYFGLIHWTLKHFATLNESGLKKRNPEEYKFFGRFALCIELSLFDWLTKIRWSSIAVAMATATIFVWPMPIPDLMLTSALKPNKQKQVNSFFTIDSCAMTYVRMCVKFIFAYIQHHQHEHCTLKVVPCFRCVWSCHFDLFFVAFLFPIAQSTDVRTITCIKIDSFQTDFIVANDENEETVCLFFTSMTEQLIIQQT